ncbi:expressed unknown protein [Seminavis robusta]|uniref:Uncharacterized protein n=1 Tax=Seminavis robusta TaxID=568900 RepID=A0A9N8EH85_9STRA|nr:expressed unknown protein [Seminavis robusta]|eukprot:Sro1162_g247920.1 n/a (1559) ;mRNA; f:21456-26317
MTPAPATKPKPKVFNPYRKTKPSISATIASEAVKGNGVLKNGVVKKNGASSTKKEVATTTAVQQQHHRQQQQVDKVDAVPPKPKMSQKSVPSDKSLQPKVSASSSLSSVIPHKKKSKSLKSKLKQEIENIRRATLLEKQRKQLRKEQKALEKKQREQERLQAIEAEKRRKQQLQDEERRRRLMEEQEKLQQERLRLQLERQQKKQQEEEEQRRRQNEEWEKRRADQLMDLVRKGWVPWQGGNGYPMANISAMPPSTTGVPSQPYFIAQQYQAHMQQQQPHIPMEPIYNPTNAAARPVQPISSTLGGTTNTGNLIGMGQAYPSSVHSNPTAASTAEMILSKPSDPPPASSSPIATAAPLPRGRQATQNQTPPKVSLQDIGAAQSDGNTGGLVTTHPSRSSPMETMSGTEKEKATSSLVPAQPSLVTPQVKLNKDELKTAVGTTEEGPSGKVLGQPKDMAAPSPLADSSKTVISSVRDETSGGHLHSITPNKVLSHSEPSKAAAQGEISPTSHCNVANNVVGANSIASSSDAVLKEATATNPPNAAVQRRPPIVSSCNLDKTSTVGASPTDQVLKEALVAYAEQHKAQSNVPTAANNLVVASTVQTVQSGKGGQQDAMGPSNDSSCFDAQVPTAHISNSMQQYIARLTAEKPRQITSATGNELMVSSDTVASSHHVAVPAALPQVHIANNAHMTAPTSHHGLAPHFPTIEPSSRFATPAAPAPAQWFPPVPGSYHGTPYHLSTNPYALSGHSYSHYPAYAYYPYPGLQMPLTAQPYGRTPKPRKPRAPKPPVIERLAWKPVDFPSPYERAYEVLTHSFVVVKKPGESFGINLREEKQSALVDPDWLIKSDAALKKPTIPVNANLSESTIASSETEKPKTCEDGGNQGTAAVNTNEVKEGVSAAVPSTAVVQDEAPCNATKDQVVVAKSEGATASTTPSGDNQAAAAPQKPKRKRRKRVFFAVMMVVDASMQNKKNVSAMHLQPGDIVLSINGEATGGQTFKEACTLFTQGCVECNSENGEKVIQCKLAIARKKPEPRPPPPLSVPSVNLPKPTVGLPNPISNILNTTQIPKPAAPLDVNAFSEILSKASLDSRRVLGASIPDDLLRSLVACSPKLVGYDLLSLKGAWTIVTSKLETSMKMGAENFWKAQWEKERELANTVATPVTDAMRARMRAAPRPTKGCKCGSQDHEYVNDPQCPLYKDVLPLSSRVRDASSEQPKATANGLDRPLNKVETALKDRFLKLKSEEKAQEEEAKFVLEMEQIQVHQMGKAVFSPSLTAMVLSVVFELQSSFPLENDTVCTEVTAEPTNDVDEEEDEEDVPLAALGGKRRALPTESASSKRHKEDVCIKKLFLAKLLLQISKTWGHLYRETEDVDYAWRWEVYHGQTDTEGGKWEPHSKNPRKVGSLSFENIRFMLTDEFLGKLHGSQTAEATMEYLVSTERTGVHDELLALVRTGILSMQGGVPRPSPAWYTMVDLNLLNEMHGTWSPAADEFGKYSVSNKMRKKLYDKWVVSEYGWALKTDPSDIVYEFEEWEEWRQTFEDKQEARSDNVHGIGRFGL